MFTCYDVIIVIMSVLYLQQPWCQQILVDLVIALNAYFASEVSWTENIDKQM